MSQQNFVVWLLLSAFPVPVVGNVGSECDGAACEIDDNSMLQRGSGKHVLKLDDGAPPLMPERDDLDAWYEEVASQGFTGSVSMLQAGSDWGLNSLVSIGTEIPGAQPGDTDETSRFRFYAHAPVVVLSNTSAIVCYDANPGSTGWCRALILENGKITRLGVRLALKNYSPYGNYTVSRADGATLWKYDGSTAIVCHSAKTHIDPPLPYPAYPNGQRLVCQALTVTDDSLAASETFALNDDDGNNVVLEPLPNGSGAVVCYSKYRAGDHSRSPGPAQSYCNVLTYDGNFSKGTEVKVNDGNMKGFPLLAAMSNSVLILCMRDGMNRRGVELPDKERGFCTTLQIVGSQVHVNDKGSLNLQKSGVYMDALVKLGYERAILCYSVSPEKDWGICAVLHIAEDGAISKGRDVRLATCPLGKSVITGIQFLPLDSNTVFTCYKVYSSLKCGQLTIGFGDTIIDNVANVLANGTGYLSDVKLASFDDDANKMMMCFSRSDKEKNGDTSGGCTVIDHKKKFRAVSGVLHNVPTPPTPAPTPPTPAPTSAPTPARRRNPWSSWLPKSAESDTWLIYGADCKLDLDDRCVTNEQDTGYDKNEDCRIKAKKDAAIQFSSFQTEAIWDKLTLGENTYSGSQAPEKTTIVANDYISWASDESVQAKGWKFCAQ